MKPATPQDPRNVSFDDLMIAALHGELSPDERTQFESRLQTDPAAAAAYHEAQAMHDLLDQTHRTAQPDPDFEQRMVSAVRRKLAQPALNETAWESLLFFWKGLRWTLTSRWKYAIGSVATLMFLAVLMAYNHDVGVLRALGDNGIANPSAISIQRRLYFPPALYANMLPQSAFLHKEDDLKRAIRNQGINYVETAQKGITLGGYVDNSYTQQFAGHGVTFPGSHSTSGGNAVVLNGGTVAVTSGATPSDANGSTVVGSISSTSSAGTPTMAFGSAAAPQGGPQGPAAVIDSTGSALPDQSAPPATPSAPDAPPAVAMNAAPAFSTSPMRSVHLMWNEAITPKAAIDPDTGLPAMPPKTAPANPPTSFEKAPDSPPPPRLEPDGIAALIQKPASNPAADNRKLIRNAQLDLEVKSFQAAFDQITALTKSAGGYIDTSNSQRGGNGKLQGTVVVKILPPNLDAFLLKLRDLGDVQNQSVSTDDVTKDYYDTQARLVNSQKMEIQLQDLLKRENGKVSDLLAVERELGRVRGDIEQMQGQLKLYDFQVQYATVTMNLAEKDLTQAAAYLLKEQDNFSLFATDVEGTFAKARQAADTFKAQVLAADLQHNSGSDVSASLDVMVAPDQIEPFLGEIRGLGRVANFTRQTQRVAKDGGDSTNPADATLTEKDKVRVQVSIRSDDDSREQVAVTVVTKAVDDALDQGKTAALAHAGVEILSSSLNKTPDGASTAQLSVRVPGPQYAALIDAFRALGRASALTIQRNDSAGPGANGDDAPVIVSLSLTDNDAPVQETDLTLAADDVDAQAQAIKKQAADAGAEVKASSFQHQPDGTEVAQITLRLPLGKYPAFLETLKKAGKVESLSVQRNDRPDQTEADDAAPADIMLQLHNPTAIIADNNGLWTTLRNTSGEGFAALFGSIRVIGVLLAFLAPWVFTLVLFAWIGRRIYVWRKSR